MRSHNLRFNGKIRKIIPKLSLLLLLTWSAIVLRYLDTHSGEATLHFHFCLPSPWESTLQGKNLLPQEQILSFKSRLYSVRALLSRVQNRKLPNLSPLENIGKSGGMPIYLELI